MSYDIYLFKPLPNKTVPESAQTVLESDINGLNQVAFDLQKKVLSEKLKIINPAFSVYNLHNKLELTSLETGVQISFYPNQIAVKIPYWYTAHESKEVFTKVFQYLQAIKAETGYAIYDPQNDTEITLDQGVESFVRTYGGATDMIEARIASSTQPRPVHKSMLTNYIILGIAIIILIVVTKRAQKK